VTAQPDSRRRADLLLVERGFFDSRARAQAAIAAGTVSADGEPVTKPSQMLPVGAHLVAEAPHPWVSRGGVKLAHALDHWKIVVAGRVCLDVGASTGGFTDVLLSRGAATVIAVDTGRGQLHPRLAADPRVTNMEATDIRALTQRDLPGIPDLATVDASFISLEHVLPALVGLLAPKADIVALVKPQFEVGRAHIGKGGIVRDRAAIEAAIERTISILTFRTWFVRGPLDSPIAGGDGNREYLLHAWRDGPR
jgi:23S rRNA (cytidine1920-2'-O)/16S rRNA (cytidine1409-2'-O)-methyltransferase